MSLTKITSEEFDKLMLHGRGKSSPFYDAVYSLKVGEAFIMLNNDWHQKYSPSKIARKLEKKFGVLYKIGKLADKSGWAIKRLK